MYGSPTIFLGEVSNREDLLLTISFFDDDTGQPINMTGITLANSGVAFTGSAWTITDGSIVTSSTTTITIPTLPITTAALAALALTVGTGLAINTGDQVVIADSTGLNTLTGAVTSYTPASGAMIVQIGWTYLFEIRRGPPRNTGSGYVPWYDFGTPGDYGPLLVATLGAGISVVDAGVIQLLIYAQIAPTGGVGNFAGLSGGTYWACMTATDGLSTRQVFIGKLPVYHGGVSKGDVGSSTSSAWAAIF
jgi:hypothetical protein